MKEILRDFIIESIYHTRTISPAFSNSGLYTIITFHRVLPENLRQQYPLPGLVTTPEELHWILSYCRKHYNCGSISKTIELWKRKNKGKKPLLAITFDDGQEDNYRYAIPVLEKLGLTSTFFVPVSNIETATPLWHDILGFTVLRLFESDKNGIDKLNESLRLNLFLCRSPIEAARAAVKRAKSITVHQRVKLIQNLMKDNNAPCPKWARMMTWQHLREINNNGHEIGSHSMTHPLLPQCSNSDLQTEIGKSREVLQEKLKIPIETFCYPNGDYDERVVKITQSAGYSCAVTTKWKANRQRGPMFQLGRCDIDPTRVKNRNGELSKSRLQWRLSYFKRFLDKFKKV